MLDNPNSGQIDAENSIIINDVSKVYTKINFETKDIQEIVKNIFNSLIDKINKYYYQNINFLPYFTNYYDNAMEHNINKFSKIIKLQNIKQLFKKLNSYKKNILPLFKYADGDELEFVEYLYNGYNTNIRKDFVMKRARLLRKAKKGPCQEPSKDELIIWVKHLFFKNGSDPILK